MKPNRLDKDWPKFTIDDVSTHIFAATTDDQIWEAAKRQAKKGAATIGEWIAVFKRRRRQARSVLSANGDRCRITDLRIGDGTLGYRWIE